MIAVLSSLRLFLRRFVLQALSSFCKDREGSESGLSSARFEEDGTAWNDARLSQNEPSSTIQQRYEHTSSACSSTGGSITPTRISSGQRFPRAQCHEHTPMVKRPQSASAHMNEINRTMRSRNDTSAGAARPRSAGVGCATVSISRWAQRRNSINSSKPSAGGRCASPQKPHRAVRNSKGKGMSSTSRNKGFATRSRRVWCGGRQGVEAAWSYMTTNNSDGDVRGVSRQIFVKVPCVRSNDSKTLPGGASYHIAWHGGGSSTDRVNDGSLPNSHGIQSENLGSEQGSNAGENDCIRTDCNVEIAENSHDLQSLLHEASLGDMSSREEPFFNENIGYNNARVADSPHTSRVLAELRDSFGREQQRRWPPSSPAPSEAASLLRRISSSRPPTNVGEAGSATTSAPRYGDGANASSGRTVHGEERVSCGHPLHPRSDIGKSRQGSFSKFRQPNKYLPPQPSRGTPYHTPRTARGRPHGIGPASAPAVRLKSWSGKVSGLPVMSEEDGLAVPRASNIGRPIDNRKGSGESGKKPQTELATPMYYSFFPCRFSEQQDGNHLSKIGPAADDRDGVSEWEEAAFGISSAAEASGDLGLDLGSLVPSEVMGW